MQVIYIYHSAFALLTDKLSLLFDYYKDSGADGHSGYVHQGLLRRPQPLYIFSSHSHYDHFSPEILDFDNPDRKVRFILASEIHQAFPEILDKSKRAITYLDRNEQYQDDLISVRAAGSTDLGISFVIKLGSKLIFHAGDLNNWHWMEESSEQEWRKAEQYFLSELDFLHTLAPKLNLAFFPADPRLGREYLRGLKQFLQKERPDYLFPMHFDAAYDKAQAAAQLPEALGLKTKVALIDKPGQIFTIED